MENPNKLASADFGLHCPLKMQINTFDVSKNILLYTKYHIARHYRICSWNEKQSGPKPWPLEMTERKKHLPLLLLNSTLSFSFYKTPTTYQKMLSAELAHLAPFSTILGQYGHHEVNWLPKLFVNFAISKSFESKAFRTHPSWWYIRPQ
jgi:hypothetical protein